MIGPRPGSERDLQKALLEVAIGAAHVDSLVEIQCPMQALRGQHFLAVLPENAWPRYCHGSEVPGIAARAPDPVPDPHLKTPLRDCSIVRPPG